MLKDIGWVCYNIWEKSFWKYFGTVNASIALLCAVYVAYSSIKWRTEDMYLDFLHVFWVLGNFLWMLSEFYEDQIKNRKYDNV
eukprot:UN17111